MNIEIKKAIIPIAGLGTRFLPLSKVLPKEIWPLVDKPVIQYIVEEAKNSGVKEIIFVNRKDKKEVKKYFQKYLKKIPEIEEILKKRGKNDLLAELKKLEKITGEISFSYMLQKKALGDGHAILQAKNSVGKKPVAVLFADDVVESKSPCLSQMIKIFKKYQRPLLALYRLPKKNLPYYGIVSVNKIEKRVYKIKGITEKPLPKEAPSNLAVVGKYILTPEVFEYLKKAKPGKTKEIILADTFQKMIKEGKDIYGYEFEGKWLECGNKLAYLKSNFYLALKHSQFGKKLRRFLKTI